MSRNLHRYAARISGLAFSALLLAISATPVAGQEGSWRAHFEEGFEPKYALDPWVTTWSISEEEINAAYAQNIGQAIQSTDASLEAEQSLLLWANQAKSSSSNRLVARKQLFNHGVVGTWRYDFSFYVPDPAGDAQFTGHTGPEFRMENTREVTAQQFTTYAAGIHYVADPSSNDFGKWQIWTEAASGGGAAWRVDLLAEFNALPAAERAVKLGEWYQIALEADFTTNRYVRLQIRGPDIDKIFALDTVVIQPESRGSTQESFLLMAAAENQQTGAQQVRHYQIYYDRVRLLEKLGPGVEVPSDALARAELTAWIMSLQYTDNPSSPSYGAIKIHHNVGIEYNSLQYYRVVPYSANLAVLGLLRERRPLSLTVAERWIDWYLSHSEVDAQGAKTGVVYDHWYEASGDGQTTRVGEQGTILYDWDDATDSYAATFLGMVGAYIEAGGSADFVRGHQAEIRIVAQVVTDLQDGDGLTWSKSTYPVKYLMDNSEVYWGLCAMEKLEREVFTGGDPAYFATAATGVQDAITNQMYDESTGLFRIAKLKDALGQDVYQDANLDQWYSGTVALLWPQIFSVIGPRSAKASAQLAALNTSWDWDPNPDWTTNIVDPTGFPWASMGYAARLGGDADRARRHASFVIGQRYQSSVPGVSGPKFAWPWTVDDAGWLLQTLHVSLPEQILTAGVHAGRRDWFGYNVEVDGDTAVLGAYGDDDNGAESGSAYVLVRSGSVWSLAAKLLPIDGEAGDFFGACVDISGDTIVVAAFYDDDAEPDNPGRDSGAVYVFEKPVGGWSGTLNETAKLTVADPTIIKRFGIGLAINGDTIAASSAKWETPGANSGNAYVFERSASTGEWAQRAKLAPGNPLEGNYTFGYRLAASSDTIAVGGVQAYGKGWVSVFVGSGAEWQEVAMLTGSDSGPGDFFGDSIAVDGDTIVVGKPQHLSIGTGAAYVFVKPANGWTSKTQDATLTASDGEDGDALGAGVAISGDTIAVGAHRDDDGIICPDYTCDSGAVYVFRRPTAGWSDGTEDLKIIASDARGDEMFGVGLAIEGSTLFAGAPYDDLAGLNHGSVFIYELPFAATQPGTDVIVEPVDPTTGTQPVALTFPEVTNSGYTTVSTTVSHQPIPSGFSLGEPPAIYEISTTATFTGSVKVCIDYSGIGFENESGLRLLHYENAQWLDITDSLDTANDVICGYTSSFSAFAVVEAADAATLLQNLIADLQAMNIHHGTKKGLTAKLKGALRAVNKGHTKAARNKPVSFIKKVKRKRGTKISEADADTLIAAAERIIRILGGS